MRPCREEDRRAEGAASEALEAFQKNFALLLEYEDMLEEEVKVNAEEVSHASRSNDTKGWKSGKRFGRHCS